MRLLVEITVDRYSDDEIMGEEDLESGEVLDLIESVLDRERHIYCEQIRLLGATLVKDSK